MNWITSKFKTSLHQRTQQSEKATHGMEEFANHTHDKGLRPRIYLEL